MFHQFLILLIFARFLYSSVITSFIRAITDELSSSCSLQASEVHTTRPGSLSELKHLWMGGLFIAIIDWFHADQPL